MALKTLVYAALRALRRIVYPQRCVCCGVFHPSLSDHEMLCPTCRTVWNEAKAKTCPDCNLPGAKCRCLPRYTTSGREETRPPISAYYHLVPYHIPTVQRMLFSIKDGHDADTALFFGRELAKLCEAAIQAYPLTPKDAWRIAYVPRHPARIQKSGTDQCKNVAKEVSLATSLPLIEVLRHTGYKAEQKLLSLESRASEARQCYRFKRGAKAKIADKYIILIDDILTSGATTAACASLLKENGAAAIVCITVAKTENKRKQ